MKIYHLLFIAFFVFSTNKLQAQSQYEMNVEAAENFQEADSILNVVYQQIRKEYADDDVFLEKLKVSQRLWIQFRDAELDARFPDENPRTYGSMYSMCYAAIKMKLTIERTKQLYVWLEGLPETEGCTGSVKFTKY